MLAVFASWFRLKDYKLFESFISLPRWNPERLPGCAETKEGTHFSKDGVVMDGQKDRTERVC